MKVMISAINAFFTSMLFCPRNEYDFTNCVENFSFSASTSGLDHGSGAGPLGFGGGGVPPAAAGGFGGGGVPPAAAGGFGGGAPPVAAGGDAGGGVAGMDS